MPARSWLRRLWTCPVTSRPVATVHLGRGMDVLEDRITPAFDLVLSSVTSNVTTTASAGVTTFEATGTGAALSLFDVFTALGTGDVIVTTGTGGTEAGNITTPVLGASSGAAIASARSLRFRSGSGVGLVGNIELPAISFANATVNLDVQAAGNVRFLGSYNSAATPQGTIALSSANGSISTDTGATLFGTTLTAVAATGVNLTTQVGSLEVQSATGGVTIRNTGNLAVGGVSAGFSGVDVTTSGSVDLQTTGTLTVNTAGDDVTTASGDIVLTADDAVLGQPVNAGAGTVTVRPASAGRQIDLGSNAAGTLGLTQAELNQITAGTVAIGRDDIATGQVTVSASAGVTGARNLSVTTARNILVNSGATLSTDTGNLTLSANRQATATAGNFSGVQVEGTVQTVAGTLAVLGRGGTDSSGRQRGVLVSGGTVQATGTGIVAVTGRGGDGDDIFNQGVALRFGGKIVGGTAGLNTVDGTGGATGTTQMDGVFLQNTNSAITTNGGDLRVTGAGGGSGAANTNRGVVVAAGATVTAGGAGAVTVSGTGGAGTGGGHIGVSVNDANSRITSAGGAVSVTGAGVTGVSLLGGGTISSGGNAAVTVTADSLGVDTGTTPGTVSAGTGTVTVRPRTAGTRINLGGADAAGVLGLTDAELDRITAGTLVVGRNDIAVGRIDVTAAVGPANATTLSLVTPANISGAGTVAASNLALRAATGINLAGANAVATVTLANSTSGAVVFNSSTDLLVAAVDGLTGATNAADLTLSTASGADLTTAAGINGVRSSSGTLLLQAGRDLLLGNGSNFGDVTGTVLTLTAGRDIVATNQTYAQGGTGVTATAGRDITIQGDALINSTGAGAPVSLTTGAGGTLTINNSISDRGSATSVGGLLTVTADDLVLTSGGLNSSGTVIVHPVSVGRAINLGTNAAGVLGLTDAELDRIAAATLVIGRDDATAAGTITASANLTLSTNVTLVTGAGVAGSSSITVGAATPTTLTVRQAGTSTFGGVLGGPGANENNFNLTFDGPGTLTLTGSNTYTGATKLSGGTLAVSTLANGGTSSGIGASTNAASNLVFDGGKLRYTGAGSVATDRGFTLNAGGGTIDVLNGATTLVVGGGGTGAGGLVKEGAGILTLTGTSNYTGGTTVSAGTLRIGNGVANGSVSGDVLNNAALQFNNPSNSTFAGDISGVGSLRTLGTSTLTVTGTHTYTGTTTVNTGTLLVNGSTDGASAVSVNNTGTLGGSGTVAGTVAVASGGTVSPGNSPGVLNTGDVSYVAGSNLAVEVDGDTPGTQYDQLVVTGTVALGGANLVTGGTIAIPNANAIVLIDNDDTDAVSGTFAGLPEGALVTINGIEFRISYVGGSGNDVVLTNTVAAAVAFSTQPPNSIAAGATFGTAVTVTNSFGDPVPGQTVTLTLTGPGTLSGVLTATTDSAGVATYSGLSLDFIGTKTLTATAGVLTATSNPITVAAAAANRVAFLTQPPNSISIGNTFATVVAVQDVFGNPVVGQSVTLSLSGTGTLFGTLTVIADSGGTASFTGLSIDTAGTKTLTATAGVATGTSNPVTVTAAPVTPINPNQNAQSTYATGAGAGGPGTVTVSNPDATVKTTINPFGNGTGARPITADVNGDGVTDTIVATGPGVRVQVAVVDGKTGAMTTFDAFEDTFTGGAFVAAGDLDGDGTAEIAVSADTTGSARVTVFNGSGTVLADFLGIDDPDFRGGARVALGDVNGDGFADLVVAAGTGGGPRIAIYDGQAVAGTFAGQPQRLLPDFFAFEPTLRNGAYVSAGDVNGDGLADLIFGGGPDGGPRVLIWDAATLVRSGTEKLLADFFAADPALRTGGVRVAAKDLDGDNLADVVVGVSTDTNSTVMAYLGKNISPNETPRVFTEFDAGVEGVFVG